MRVIFRADGNSTIGLGHIVRSLALAEVVAPLFTERWLAVRAPSEAVRQLARQARVQVLPLAASETPTEAAKLAASYLRATDVVVLDGYQFDTAYQRAVMACGCRLVAIDDVRAWPQAADLVINHAPGITADMYQAPATTRFCLGPEFSLVRPPFRHQFQLPTPPAPVHSIVVCFGGADPEQLTLATLRALLQEPGIKQVSLVVGSAFQHLEALTETVQTQAAGKARIYQNVGASDMAALFLAHQAVVCPASTVLLESLLLGRPVVTGYYAENQRHLADYVHAHSQAYSLGNFLAYSGSQLAAALALALRHLETHARQPYARELKTHQLQAEFQRLLTL